MKFITAIYNGLHDTKFGGRLNRDKQYLYSLECLSNLGSPIKCYVQQSEYETITSYFVDKGILNIEFEPFELSDFKYHKEIQRIKEINKNFYAQDDVWEYRCVELMWLKLFALFNESIKFKESGIEEKIFWIDAGLSHDGIFPKRFNPNANGTQHSLYQNNLAFNNKLVDKLDKLSNESLFFFYCNNRQHSYPPLYSNIKTLDGSIVAGLFGGKPNDIIQLVIECEQIIEYILSKDTLLQEELILTLVLQNNPQMFNLFNFTTWYHEDWNCYDPSVSSFSDFFNDLGNV